MGFVYPRKMRTTRDLLRRRLFFARQRGELFGHIRSTFQQYNKAFPSSGQPRYKKHRERLAEAFDDPALRATIEADLALAHASSENAHRLLAFSLGARGAQ